MTQSTPPTDAGNRRARKGTKQSTLAAAIELDEDTAKVAGASTGQ